MQDFKLMLETETGSEHRRADVAQLVDLPVLSLRQAGLPDVSVKLIDLPK